MADNQTILIIHNNKKESKMKRFNLVVSFSVIAGCANIEEVNRIAISWGNDEIFSTMPSELSSKFAATTILCINKAVLSALETAYPFAQLGYADQDKTLTVLETKENVTPLCMAGFNMFMVELEEKVYHKMGKLEQFIDGLNNMLDTFEGLVGLEKLIRQLVLTDWLYIFFHNSSHRPERALEREAYRR